MRFVSLSAVFVVVTAVSVCFGDVVGSREERLGVGWSAMEFGDWVLSERAVLTPETLGIAGQACLRSAQARLDLSAAQIASRLSDHLRAYAERETTSRFAPGLRSVARLLTGVQAIRASSGNAFESTCRAQVTAAMRRDRDAVYPLFEGRMHPRVPEELAKKGIRIVPLTWEALQAQICKLEGYYASSHDARMWKLFSTTRLLSNILPTESRSEELVKALEGSPEIMSDIAVLDSYSSVAGKYNGATLGMTAAEREAAPVRLTGVAIGSRAASVLATFTTGWREKLQTDVVAQNYPLEPFHLLSLSQILAATAHVDRDALRPHASATELGMSAVWASLAGSTANDSIVDYGQATYAFRKTAGLAWLALNAEMNVRQNEKLAGLERVVLASPTSRILGDEAAFMRIAGSLAAARRAYLEVDPTGRSVASCVAATTGLAYAAADAVHGREGKIISLDPHLTAFLEDIVVPPVIADIGTEVNDEVDGVFRLHLATGRGRAVSSVVGGQEISLWTPSAFVLHLADTTSTAAWQSRLVKDHDKP